MWKLISIYFGCTFITCTFCDTGIYLLNYLCKADTEVTEKIKLDILRSCLSFKAVEGCSSKYLQGDFWLILSVKLCCSEQCLCSVVKPFRGLSGSGSAPLKLLLDMQVKSLKLMDYKWLTHISGLHWIIFEPICDRWIYVHFVVSLLFPSLLVVIV